MASSLPSSGTIKFSDIENEFGQGENRSMGDYRRPNEYGDMVLPIDDGVPTSGPIKFSDFYGKELNIMVDCYSQQDDDESQIIDYDTYAIVGTRIDAKDYFNQGRCHNVGVKLTKDVTTVEGGDGGGKKVIIHVNKVIQSEKSIIQGRCALRTGSNWKPGTRLRIEVGGKGIISGAGGDGGVGGSYGSNAWADDQKGSKGTSGLGIEWDDTEVTVMSSDTPYRKSSGTPGYIAAGLGGGGGGGAAKVTANNKFCWAEFFGRCILRHDEYHSYWGGGGGGGGGQGWPAGNPGKGGVSGTNSNGTAVPNGDDGQIGRQPQIDDIGTDTGTVEGDGGEGHTQSGTAGGSGNYSAIGGDGGDGGNWEGSISDQDGQDGEDAVSCGNQGPDIGPSNSGCGSAGAGGEDGAAIADGGHTGDWTYGTYHDGERVFGIEDHYYAS